MTDADRQILDRQPLTALPGWYCLMNAWGWPPELPDEPPAEYFPNDRRAELMTEIVRRVGHRAVSRAWNYTMTDAEHADFYAGNFEGDAAALARHRATPAGVYLDRMWAAPKPPWAVETQRQWEARNGADPVITTDTPGA